MIKKEIRYVDSQTDISMTITNGHITFWNSQRSGDKANSFTFIGSRPDVVRKVLRSLKALVDEYDLNNNI